MLVLSDTFDPIQGLAPLKAGMSPQASLRGSLDSGGGTLRLLQQVRVSPDLASRT